jgi:hypothetical protein
MAINRDAMIAACCLDEGRPGKVMEALATARAIDPSVRLRDVREWMKRHRERLVGGGDAEDIEASKDDYIKMGYEATKDGKSGKQPRQVLAETRKLMVAAMTEGKGYSKSKAQKLVSKVTIDDVNSWLKKHDEQPPAEKPEEPPVEEKPEEEPLPMDKEQIIGDAFNKYSNFGNVAETLEDARKVDKSITRKDVMAYKNKYYIPLRYHRGVNSYVAKQPKEEYQIDLMFFKDLDKKAKEDQQGPYAGALLAVDIFTKYCAVEPITGTDEDAVLRGLKECIKSLGVTRKWYITTRKARSWALRYRSTSRRIRYGPSRRWDTHPLPSARSERLRDCYTQGWKSSEPSGGTNCRAS